MAAFSVVARSIQVIRAFNQNLPFDQFTILHLAGNLLPDASIDDWIATGFHRNTMTNTEGGTDDEEFRDLAIRDRIATTARCGWGKPGLRTVPHAHCVRWRIRADPMRENRTGVEGPYIGRDHHPYAFTMMMAGGGFKRGFNYGETDEIGYYGTKDKMTPRDLQATVLHQIGLDAYRLHYAYQGLNQRRLVLPMSDG